ncbi:FtsX-like permease family protein [Nevskia sp.]|uniref:ABC transporter permease n=1 Tax=Nevskia sp. TaxID=1929292 RepID=UPI0025F6097E|nr:FtsX-like permease family protein [Nevskia sp.]
MELRPILSALMRSRVALVLLGLQIALTLAIVCNSLFIISERAALMERPSGMNEADTFVLSSIGFGADFNLKNAIAEDVNMMRSLPGVVDAAPINSVPLSNGGWSSGLSLSREQKTASAYSTMYFTDDHGLETLGARIVAGRNYRPDELGERNRKTAGWPPGIIITKALGEKLWPGQDPIGKTVWLDTEADASTIIGIVDRLQAPWVHSEELIEHATILPQVIIEGAFTRYIVRAAPGQRDAVMKAAEAKMVELNPSRIVREGKTIEKFRADAYADDRAMMIILGTVIVSLLIITALGIVGMASFWVTQRTKQIGTRRALGATRGAILRYFLAENFVITTLGLVLGTALAYGFNVWLIQNYETQTMPWYYVPVGCLSLWMLGQLAVLGPARRASRVPPAMATRSV